MAKGIRSKRLQKFKAMKRDVVRKTVDADRLASLGKAEPKKKNAFLYPNDPDAEFPQRRHKMGIDFRSDAITPFETLVRSTKMFEQREEYRAPERIVGRAPEENDLYMGDLGRSLKYIEKGMNKVTSMKID